MLKKLKSLFIIEEEVSPGKKSHPKEEKSNESEEDNPSVEIPDIDTGSHDSSKPDPKFINILLKAIESSNIEGFDYLEFKQSLQSLKNMNMDEKTKYQSAFAMAKTMGASTGELLESANHYMKVLEKEDQKFNEALRNQNKIKIEDQKKEITRLENMIKKKEEQIEQLKKEIDTHRKQLSNKSEEINEAVSKVKATKNRFEQAYEIVRGQIQTDVENIQKYIES